MAKRLNHGAMILVSQRQSRTSGKSRPCTQIARVLGQLVADRLADMDVALQRSAPVDHVGGEVEAVQPVHAPSNGVSILPRP